jgi:predicted transcriptional regulator
MREYVRSPYGYWEGWQKVPDKAFEAFKLKQQGLSYVEIAKQLGLTVNTTKTYAQKGKELQHVYLNEQKIELEEYSIREDNIRRLSTLHNLQVCCHILYQRAINHKEVDE